MSYKEISFDIRSYVGKELKIVKEYNTQWKVECPNCGGKLVVNKHYPKYMCVTDWCSPNDIRTKLGVLPFQSSNVKTTIPVKPLLLPSNFNLVKTENNVNTTYKESKNHIENKKLLITTYDYGKGYSVVRYDFYVNNRKLDKEFRPYKDGKIVSYTELCLYRETYMSSTGVYLWTEGEKCTDRVVQEGYAGFTVAGGVSCNMDYIVKRLSLNLDKIRGVVIIPDMDRAGEKKARLMEEACWKCRIPTKKIDINKYEKYLNEGEDIEDLLDLGLTLPEIIYG